MKTIKMLNLILSFGILLAACSKTKSDSPAPSTPEESLKQSRWQVTYYEERGKNETDKFNGYTLIFEDNGTFIFKIKSQSFTGKWSIEDRSDDSDPYQSKLVLWITGNNTADELQDDWYILDSSDNLIRLHDDNTNHTEILEIKKL